MAARSFSLGDRAPMTALIWSLVPGEPRRG